MTSRADLFDLNLRLDMQTAQFQRGVRQANRQLERMERRTKQTSRAVQAAGAAIRTFGAGLVGALAGGAAIRQITNLIDEFDELAKSAQAAGVSSAQALSELRLAAELSGATASQLDTGLRNLNRAIAEVGGGGTSKAARTLAALGIAALDSAGDLRDVSQILPEVAEAFALLEDGPAKTAAAMEIFGRSGTALIPLLNAGAQGVAELTARFSELGGEITSQDAALAQEFNDNLTELGVVAKTTGQNIVSSLLPALVILSQELVKATSNWDGYLRTLEATSPNAAAAGDAVRTTSSSFGVLETAADAATLPIKAVGDGLVSLFEKMVRGESFSANFAARVTGRVTDSLKRLQGDIEETDRALVNLATRDYGTIGAEELDIGVGETIDASGLIAERNRRLLQDRLAAVQQTTQANNAATAASREAATAAREQAQAEERAADAIESKAAAITQSVATATELYADRLRELDGLLRQGAISQETFRRAVADAEDSLRDSDGTNAAIQRVERFKQSLQTAGEELEAFQRDLEVAVRLDVIDPAEALKLTDEKKASLERDYRDTAQTIEGFMVSAGESLGLAIADSAETGALSFEAMIESMLRDLGKLVASEAFRAFERVLTGEQETASGSGSLLGGLFDSLTGLVTGGAASALTGAVTSAVGGSPTLNLTNTGVPLEVQSLSMSGPELDLVVSTATAQTQTAFSSSLRRGYGGFAEPLGAATTAGRPT